jgi:hypothetical protein
LNLKNGLAYFSSPSLLISNQAAAYDRPWTAYFLGQRKCDDLACFEIDFVGQIRATLISPIYATFNRTLPTPIGLSSAGWAAGGPGTECWGSSWRSYLPQPSLSTAQRLSGAVPTDWEIPYLISNWPGAGCEPAGSPY